MPEVQFLQHHRCRIKTQQETNLWRSWCVFSFRSCLKSALLLGWLHTERRRLRSRPGAIGELTAGGEEKGDEAGAGGEEEAKVRAGDEEEVEEKRTGGQVEGTEAEIKGWISAVRLMWLQVITPSSDLERSPQDNHNLRQLNTARETEWEREREWTSGHSADPSTSLEEITPTTPTTAPPGGLYAAKSINFQPSFLSSTAGNQAGKQALALFVWWVWTLHSSLFFSCFPSLSPHCGYPAPLLSLMCLSLSNSFPTWEDLVLFPSNW